MSLMKGKVVIITGAGREKGMGQAAAHKFAEHGAKVVVTDLVRDGHEEDWNGLNSIVAKIQENGGDALALGVDVTNKTQIEACVTATIEKFGRIDSLINNAGTAIGAGPFLEQTERVLDISYNVHVKGAFLFSQAVIPTMQKQGGGTIVNNASMLGIAAEAYTAAYTATKFAVVGLTKTIAAEFGCDNIRCNAVCPGSINTLMQEDGLKQFAAWAGITLEEARKDAERCALGRSAEPEEVADVMVYLASPMSSYISGDTIRVDGAANPGV